VAQHLISRAAQFFFSVAQQVKQLRVAQLPVAQLAQRPTTARVAPSSLVQLPGGARGSSPTSGRTPSRAAARAAPRAGRTRAPPLPPWARASGSPLPLKRAASPAPFPFRPTRAAQRRRHPNPRPPPPLRFPSVLASPPTRSSAGASRGGEETARMACVRSHALNRRHKLAGVASAPPAALSRCAPPSSPTCRSGCVG
jgi:hypothetical protein